MKGIATVFALLFWTCGVFAVSVLPLFSTPENPLYLRYVPEILSEAKEEILVALSDLRTYADGATDALLFPLFRAAQNGLSVYVLMDKTSQPLSPAQEEALERLRAAGARVRTDPPDITLHAKFLVIDCRIVVVGSTHWTKTALTRSVQVDVVLEAPEIAKAFRAFFFYLWEGKLKTKTKLPTPPWPKPALVPLLDFPESKGHFHAAFELLSQAQKEILLLLYNLVYYPQYPDSPSTRLLGALAEAAQRGVRVKVLLEGDEESPAGSNRLSAAWLATYGVEVRFDPVGITMHAKCLIVDGRHVLISSANWTYSGLVKNLEAGIIFLGVPQVAQLLMAQFMELWEASSSPFR